MGKIGKTEMGKLGTPFSHRKTEGISIDFNNSKTIGDTELKFGIRSLLATHGDPQVDALPCDFTWGIFDTSTRQIARNF